MKPLNLISTTFVAATVVAAAAAFGASHSIGGLLAGATHPPGATQAPPAAPAPASAVAAAIPSAVATAASPEPRRGICGLHDGSFTGRVTDAYYGAMQVQAIVKSGCLASVKVLQYPADRRTSQYINSQALPILQSEVVQAQNGRIDLVTGATLTSEAYVGSLADALRQARS